MDIFWRLLFAHMLADFTLQTNWINMMKRKSVKGIFIHVFIHIVVTMFLVSDYLNDTWFNVAGIKLKGYFIIILLYFLHLLIDYTRAYIIKKGIYPDNTFNFIADQIFHIYFIFIFTPFNNVPANFGGEKLIIILTFLVLVTHTTTIFIYFIEKDLYGLPFPSFDQKYFMIIERIILWAFFLIKGWFWLPFWIAWVFQLYYFKNKKTIDITNLNFYLSIFITVFFGLLSRYYLYGHIL